MRRLVLLLTMVVVAGCGGDEPAVPVSLALDFTPNPVHAPLYAAARASDLDIRPPGSGPDALKLVAAGKVDLGVLDIHDLAIARQQGVDVVAVGVLIGKPLAALIAQPEIKRPRQLEGRKVGVSGLPSDPAFVRAIVEYDGGDFDKLELVTIGFTATSRLLSRRVDAVPAFWNAEGAALRVKGHRSTWMKVEEYGAPAYPEVVLITSPATLKAKRERLSETLHDVMKGVGQVRADPGSFVTELAAAADTDDVAVIDAQMQAVLPLYEPDLRVDRPVLEAWAAFDAEIGIVEAKPDVAAAFDFSLVE